MSSFECWVTAVILIVICAFLIWFLVVRKINEENQRLKEENESLRHKTTTESFLWNIFSGLNLFLDYIDREIPVSVYCTLSLSHDSIEVYWQPRLSKSKNPASKNTIVLVSVINDGSVVLSRGEVQENVFAMSNAWAIQHRVMGIIDEFLKDYKVSCSS